MLPETIEWIREAPLLRLLDQRNIPASVSFVDCSSYEKTAEAIENMTVRGAPAIGVVAAYGVVLAAHSDISKIEDALSRLSATRPTAVNLFWSIEKCDQYSTKIKIHRNFIHCLSRRQLRSTGKTVRSTEGSVLMGLFFCRPGFSVITHCNAGALATSGYGTALGVFRAARDAGKEIKVYADETRPRFQGGKLTAFELCEDGFDVTVICDSMAAFLMSREKIDAVITGADRIALNGDTANKIGTYGLANFCEKAQCPILHSSTHKQHYFNCLMRFDPIEERVTLWLRK